MLQKIHLWVGLIVGGLFCLSGLTGSVLIFDDELDAFFNSGLWYVKPQPGPIKLDEATDKIQSNFPNHALLLARLPRESSRSIEYWMEGEELQLVYVNPWTLEILGHREEHSGFLGFLHDLHVHLLAGDEGLLANGVMGLVLLLMVLTGLWLAWPGWRKLLNALRIPKKESRVARWFALHRSVGLISMVLLFIAALTGAAMVFHKQTNAALIAVFGGPGLQRPPSVDAAESQAAQKFPSEMLKTAESAVPGTTATWIKFPTQPDMPFLVRLRYPDDFHPNGTSYVAMDAVTGEVVMNHDVKLSGTGQQIADLKYPLHIGTVAGLPGRAVIFIAGLIPTILFVTGAYTWWYRRQKTPGEARKSISGPVDDHC